MCGTIKHKGQAQKVGDDVFIQLYKTRTYTRAHWAGYIREEKLNWWMDNTRLLPVEILCSSFIEGRYEMDVPSGRILAYQLMETVIVDGRTIGEKGDIKMLTRKPLNHFEANIRPRWPMVKVGPKRKLHSFHPWDMKGKLQAGQLELPDMAAEE